MIQWSTFQYFGSVPASFDRIADYKQGVLKYPLDLLPYKSDIEKRYYVLTVSGNSMYPSLFDNDKILIDTKLQPQNGDIGVFYIDGDTTVKVLKEYTNSIELVPINVNYETKVIMKKDLQYIDFFCFGKVVQLIKRKM